MTQLAGLVKALKSQLRASGSTYADVAEILGLSEVSVKRLFAGQSFSLQRMEKILAHLDMDFSDLVESARREERRVECLTVEQESEIAADIELLLVAVSVINGFSYEDLLDYYALSEHVLIRKLAQLDRLKLLELLPGNRVRLRVAANFRWQTNGPIQRFFLERVATDFFNSAFDGTTEKLLVLNGLCSGPTNLEIQRRLDQFLDEISTLCKKDNALPMAHRHGNTLVLALRQWRYGRFARYLRGGT